MQSSNKGSMPMKWSD